MHNEITSVVIDGVTFVPESEIAPPVLQTTDCDGHGIMQGERVYVRQSVLKQYPNLTSVNRHGSLVSFNDGDSTLTIQFDNDNQFTFPRNQMRRNPVQF